MHPARQHILGWFALAAVLGVVSSARAQNSGFQISRHEPTPAGEWSFMVDHPWYSSTRWFAGGLTLDYAHNPYVLGRRNSDGSFSQISPILSTQLYGHFDFAGSFLDRVNVALSLPVLFAERGQAAGGVTPTDGGSVSDPRLSVMVRAFGHADRSPISIHAGAAVWFPLRQFTDSLPPQVSDQTARFMPKLVLGGLFSRFRWSFTFGFLYRAEAVLGTSTTVGSEIQFGFAGSYADLMRRFAIGPEMLLSTIVTGGNAFQRDYTSLEILFGGHYNLLGQVQLGAAVGLGVLRDPGTPDVRVLLRAAYAPIRGARPGDLRDRDGDGISDAQDACPNERGLQSNEPGRNGCPPPDDLDLDGVVDSQDVCPRLAGGNHPDPARPGCPSGDRDGDGYPDSSDRCPDAPVGTQPDGDRPGCPLGDQDGDGVADREDVCPQTPKGDRPDLSRLGCPMQDQDRDGVPDAEDQCPDVPAGPNPDIGHLGCPLPTGKKAPPPPAEKVEGHEALLQVMHPIFFKKRRARLEKDSLPALEAVAAAVKSERTILRLRVRGHTDADDDGPDAAALSQKRAEVVRDWLVAHGVEPARLEAKGFGSTVPFRPGRSASGRIGNARADFRVLDPPLSEAESQAAEDRFLGAEPPTVRRPHRARKAAGPKQRSELDDALDDVERQQGGKTP